MIEVKNLVKRYGKHMAVDHLSFTLEPGRVYGFLGPNGAGKSTTMNMMTGYLGATEGEVLIDGHNILEEPEQAKACIGYLPEMPPLYMEMKVREYLEFAAELKKLKRGKRAEQVEEVMRKTRLTDMQGRLIRNLSKGYRQRVGLAQALLGNPGVMILDEPMVGLDPKQIIEIRELIRELAKEHTVLLSSHILSEISEVCDYIMILSHGRLVASDTAENLEKKMRGENSLELLIKGNAEEILPLLKRLPGIVEAECEESTDENIQKVQIETTEGRDIREELFYLFAEHRLPILQMMNRRVSLEEVFLELTDATESEKVAKEAEK